MHLVVIFIQNFFSRFILPSLQQKKAVFGRTYPTAFFCSYLFADLD